MVVKPVMRIVCDFRCRQSRLAADNHPLSTHIMILNSQIFDITHIAERIPIGKPTAIERHAGNLIFSISPLMLKFVPTRVVSKEQFVNVSDSYRG